MSTFRICVVRSLLAASGSLALIATPAHAQSNEQPDEQPDKGVVAFSSIVDGQPGDPGQIGVVGLASIADGDWEVQSTLQYTGKSPLLSNSIFSVSFPTIQGGEGIADTEQSMSFGWQQRWLGSANDSFNLATALTVQVPINEPQQDVDYTATLALAATAGPGVGYLTAYVETKNGPNPEPTEYGAFLGYKLPVSDRLALITDVNYQRGDIVGAEFAAQLDVGSGFTFGPGISISTGLNDGTGGVSVAAGIVVARGF